MKKRYFTRAITVVVSDSTYQELTEVTNKHDCSLSEWIRAAIQQGLPDKVKIYRLEKLIK